MPVDVSVELMRIGVLVHVIARADATDPAFRDSFPMMFSRVERYPVLSIARDPLAELGQSMARSFVDEVAQTVRGQLEARRLAREAFAKLQADAVKASLDPVVPSAAGESPGGRVPS